MENTHEYSAIVARSPHLTRRQLNSNSDSTAVAISNDTHSHRYIYFREVGNAYDCASLIPRARASNRARSPIRWEGVHTHPPTVNENDAEALLSDVASLDEHSSQDDMDTPDESEVGMLNLRHNTHRSRYKAFYRIAVIVSVGLLFVTVAVPPIAAIGLMYAFRPSHYTTTPEDCCGIPQIAYNDFMLHPIDVRTGDSLTLQARFYNATAAPPVVHPDARIKYNTTNNGHCIVVVHGHGSNQARWKENEISIIGKAVHPLVSAGFNVLTFDQRNHGKSEWFPPVSLGYYENYDVSAAIDWLLDDQNDVGPKRCASGRVGLWGESMGGVVVLLAAARDDRVSVVVDESGFSSARLAIPAWINNKIAYLPRFMENQLVWWMQAVSPFSLDELEIASHLAKGILSIPALLVHGTTDAIVPYTEGVSNYDSLYHSRHPHTNNTPPIDGPTHHNDSHIPWTRSQERAGHLSTSAQQRRLVERDGPVMDVDARSRAIDRGKRVLSMTRAQLQRALVDVEGARVNRRRGVDLDGSHGIERGGVEVRGRGADKWQRAQRARASIGIENLRVDRKRDGDVQRIGYHGNDNKGVREGEVIPRSMGHTINRRRNELKGTHAHDRARIRREDSRSAEVGLKGSKQLRLLFWTHVYGHVRAYLDSEYQITLVRFMEAFV